MRKKDVEVGAERRGVITGIKKAIKMFDMAKVIIKNKLCITDYHTMMMLLL